MDPVFKGQSLGRQSTHTHTLTHNRTLCLPAIMRQIGQTEIERQKRRRWKEQQWSEFSINNLSDGESLLCSRFRWPTCAQWFLNTIIQVSGSTPRSVRDFLRLPPTTTEAIILTGSQAAIACSSTACQGWDRGGALAGSFSPGSGSVPGLWEQLLACKRWNRVDTLFYSSHRWVQRYSLYTSFPTCFHFQENYLSVLLYLFVLF